MYSVCRHIMPNGCKCHSPALRGKPFCYFHTRLHGLAAKPAAAPGAPLKLPILEDRSAIQVALAQVLDALGSSRIDPRRAGLFLYALQIASRNVERDCDIVPITTVHSITHTDTGDELGPEIKKCEPPEDCSDCDKRDTCPDYEPEEDEEYEAE